jgi:hypothetical protein
MLTYYCATEHEEKSAKDPKRMRLPDYNEVPEYGLEALVSTIDDEKELLAAVREMVRGMRSWWLKLRMEDHQDTHEALPLPEDRICLQGID